MECVGTAEELQYFYDGGYHAKMRECKVRSGDKYVILQDDGVDPNYVGTDDEDEFSKGSEEEDEESSD